MKCPKNSFLASIFCQTEFPDRSICPARGAAPVLPLFWNSVWPDKMRLHSLPAARLVAQLHRANTRRGLATQSSVLTFFPPYLQLSHTPNPRSSPANGSSMPPAVSAPSTPARHNSVGGGAEASTPNGSGLPQCSKGIKLFFRKVYNLANARLAKFCEELRCKKDLRPIAWTLFEHALRTDVRHHVSLSLGFLIAGCCAYETEKSLFLSDGTCVESFFK